MNNYAKTIKFVRFTEKVLQARKLYIIYYWKCVILAT
jgi:hypothetical protein